MKPWHKALSLVAATLLCSCQDDPPSRAAHGNISLEVTNSLAIPNHRIAISVSGNQLSVTRQNHDGVPLENSKELTTEELASIWKSVDAVDWSTVRKDKILGLDGTTYSVLFGGTESEVWSPEDNTEGRDLTPLVEFKTLLWQIAEITQGEQAVAPNRSLPPSQKSTSPVRGSED